MTLSFRLTAQVPITYFLQVVRLQFSHSELTLMSRVSLTPLQSLRADKSEQAYSSMADIFREAKGASLA